MIIRNKNRKTFTVISNQAINDTQLSDKALGTLVRLLSKTDNWNLNINYMTKSGKQGRTAIRSSVAELEKAGYIHKQSGRTKSGQITRTEYFVYEDAVADNYPGTSFTSNGLKLRFAALKEFTIDQVEMAAVKLIQTHKYNSMPTTADIINAMGGMPGQIDRDHRAELEAGKVLDVLKFCGTSATPAFEDPITKHLMSPRWRWYAWASKVKEDDLKWWCKDFVRAYKAHAVGVDADFFLPAGSLLGELAQQAMGG